MSISIQGLYAITDSQLLQDRLLSYCEAALKGGVQLLQYRDKGTDHEQRYREASELALLCNKYNAQLIINDDLILACKIANVGLHLGQKDGSLIQARDMLGKQAIIGATCHASLDLAYTAKAQGASYLAFGRFFPSQTKPDAPSANIDLLTQAKAQFALPLVAIGGITLQNAPSLISQGANALAVIHALFAQPTAAQVQHCAEQFSLLFPA
ncbi:thiamine phosphate synthase [Pseudomonas sp. F1_0610]|uniref:thiamine phosphate synthase n=1 Tax=Pseudomonas sp. F1_0610 TaxID=3114284 RepID=UPI0039C11A91